jgi:hypothetical protein
VSVSAMQGLQVKIVPLKSVHLSVHMEYVNMGFVYALMDGQVRVVTLKIALFLV